MQMVSGTIKIKKVNDNVYTKKLSEKAAFLDLYYDIIYNCDEFTIKISSSGYTDGGLARRDV